MILKDILARELKAWPGNDLDSVLQLKNGILLFSGPDNNKAYGSVYGMADDYSAAKVTRAEWQAAVEALKAEQESAPAIDWSKQPKEFPLWLEGTTEEHRKHSGWYRKDGEVFTGEDTGQWRASREGQFFTVHRKPVNKAVVAEQAAELKWPDGAEFMGTTKEGSPKVFYRNVDGDYEYRYESQVCWSKSKGAPVHTPLIPRPAERAVEWDGDSMIGKDFEVTKGTASWYESDKQFIGKKCTVRATFTTKQNVNIASVEFSDGACLSIRADLLKGIRTQEQIEDEEIKDIEIWLDANIEELGAIAKTLHRSGFRKQVAE